MRGYLRLGLLLLLLTGSSLADDKWTQVRSPNFTVMSDAGDKKTREVALRFEQMRIVFANLLQRAKVNIPVPVHIIAFKSHDEIKRYSKLFKGKPVELAGFFAGG